MEFLDLLWPTGGGIVALVGGGGKTAVMARASREAAERGAALLLTVTTKLQRPCPVETERIVRSSDPGAALPGPGERVLWVGEPAAGGGKWSGPGPSLIDAAAEERPELPILVEADGASGRPVKAPGGNEPVIPASADAVAAVVGLSALGRPIDGNSVHRIGSFLEMTGARVGGILGPEHVASLLTHPLGNFRGAPGRARRIVILNQADAEGGEASAARIIEALRLGISRSSGMGRSGAGFSGTVAVASAIGNGEAIRSIVSL